MTVHAPEHVAPREEPATVPRWRRPEFLLLVVAVVHTASPLILLGRHYWFGIDETVYLSQINRYVPAGLFSAPRARGMTFVAAPVTLLVNSLSAVRVWVALVSGVALWLSFRPWLRIYSGYAVPLAAALFASLWIVTYYGFEVMPNEWVAFGVLAACGYALCYQADPQRRFLIAVAVAMAWVSLVRPSDAVYAGVALAACILLLRRAGRWLPVLLAIALGAAVGFLEWVIEAEVSYGGLAARIRGAQGENGGGGLHFAGAAQFRALAGPVLCRNGCVAHSSSVYQLWWIALVVLVALGIAGAGSRRALAVVPTVLGLALVAEYFFTVTYAAPRFLIPAYALLSLPAALGALTLVHRAPTVRWRTAVIAILGIGFLGHAAIQARVITHRNAPGIRAANADILGIASTLRAHGVRPDCLIRGYPSWNQSLAYALRCTNVPGKPAEVRAALVGGTQMVWLTSRQPRGYPVKWTRVKLNSRRSPYAYISESR